MNPTLLAQLKSINPTEGEWQLTSLNNIIINGDVVIIHGASNDDTNLMHLAPAMRKALLEMEEERFTMPTDKQLIDIAVLFNDGVLDREKLTDMVSMCQLILDRLHEHGTIEKPSSKENEELNTNPTQP
jgi:hypothetical protein